ncbi:hypothetical protein [Nostoc sp.]
MKNCQAILSVMTFLGDSIYEKILDFASAYQNRDYRGVKNCQ